jgi:hypothetical protein
VNQQGSTLLAVALFWLNRAIDQNSIHATRDLNADKCFRVGDPICAERKPILRRLLIADTATGCNHIHLPTSGLCIQIYKKKPRIRVDSHLTQNWKIRIEQVDKPPLQNIRLSAGDRLIETSRNAWNRESSSRITSSASFSCKIRTGPKRKPSSKR